jgi:GxxExxY protein
MEDNIKHKEVTNLLIKAFFQVYNTLGHGFIEKVYEKAMAVEARRLGLTVKRQLPIKVYYCDTIVGEYYPDLSINDVVLVEIKAIDKLMTRHDAQLINYLKATTYEVGLLLNSGPKADFRRRILDNHRKGDLSWHYRKSNLKDP